jgi:hypothetical protein
MKPVGYPVHFSNAISGGLENFLATKVVGEKFTGKMPNGDWVVNVSDLEAMANHKVLPSNVITRVLPPGAKVPNAYMVE